MELARKYEENHFVIILGGLHIEMAGLKVIGNWLEDCGWVEALVQAKVAFAGTRNSFLKVSHVTRTTHAHQVTASCLHILLFLHLWLLYACLIFYARYMI